MPKFPNPITLPASHASPISFPAAVLLRAEKGGLVQVNEAVRVRVRQSRHRSNVLT